MSHSVYAGDALIFKAMNEGEGGCRSLRNGWYDGHSTVVQAIFYERYDDASLPNARELIEEFEERKANLPSKVQPQKTEETPEQLEY